LYGEGTIAGFGKKRFIVQQIRIMVGAWVIGRVPLPARSMATPV
jgi:hypothetical protein